MRLIVFIFTFIYASDKVATKDDIKMLSKFIIYNIAFLVKIIFY